MREKIGSHSAVYLGNIATFGSFTHFLPIHKKSTFDMAAAYPEYFEGANDCASRLSCICSELRERESSFTLFFLFRNYSQIWLIYAFSGYS